MKCLVGLCTHTDVHADWPMTQKFYGGIWLMVFMEVRLQVIIGGHQCAGYLDPCKGRNSNKQDSVIPFGHQQKDRLSCEDWMSDPCSVTGVSRDLLKCGQHKQKKDSSHNQSNRDSNSEQMPPTASFKREGL